MSDVIDYDPVPPELKGGVVIEVGAYEGAWVRKVKGQCPDCAVFAFEPATRAYQAARRLLKGYEGVELHNVALGKQEGKATLCDRERDGANTFDWNPEGEPGESVRVIDAAEVVRPLGEVAVMHLNAEGGEVDVLERLIETGLIEQIKMILVQWHPYNDEMWGRIQCILDALALTHDREDRVAWGCWTRKDEPCCQKS